MASLAGCAPRDDAIESSTHPAMPLPVALDLKTLYEQILFTYIDLSPRGGETLETLVERVKMIRKHRRELQALEAKMTCEKQFNRKVELNTRVREIQERLRLLTGHC